MGKTYVNVVWTAVVFTSTQSIARSHRSYIPVRNNTIWNSLLCSPRLSAGQSSISASHPTGKCPSVDLLLESTSISVPPSLARIRNDPRNLAVVPCACLWHDHFSSIVPSHCAFVTFIFTIECFDCHCLQTHVQWKYFTFTVVGRIPASSKMWEKGSSVLSISGPPPLLITGPSLLRKWVHYNM